MSDYAAIRRDMEIRRAEAIARAERFGRRVTAAVWLIAFLCFALGIGVILLSYHLKPQAEIAFWAGVTLCFAGPYFTWIVALTLGRDRGFWT